MNLFTIYKTKLLVTNSRSLCIYSMHLPRVQIGIINQALPRGRTRMYTILSKSLSLSLYCHYCRHVWNISLRFHILERGCRPRGSYRFLRSICVNLIFADNERIRSTQLDFVSAMTRTWAVIIVISLMYINK